MIEWYECSQCGAILHNRLTCFCGGQIDRPPLGRRNKSKLSRSEKRRRQLARRDGPYCQGCGAQEKLTIDHKLSASRGGTDTLDNLWLLCQSCNHDKGQLTMLEWLSREVVRDRPVPRS